VAATAGEVVDESRNMISVRDGLRIRHIVKSQAVFDFVLPAGERVRLNGRELVGRPEDRVKRLR
jgi:ribonuclease P protein subunit POP4